MRSQSPMARTSDLTELSFVPQTCLGLQLWMDEEMSASSPKFSMKEVKSDREAEVAFLADLQYRRCLGGENV